MLAQLLIFAQLAAAPAQVERWYEVDLQPSGAEGELAPACGLALDALADALVANRFDGAVLWIAPTKGSQLPHEPVARRVGAEAVEPPLEAACKLLLERHLATAVGIADANDARAAAGAATFRALRIDGASGATDVVRLARPAMRSLYWCDPDFGARTRARAAAAAFSVSERLVASSRPELRAL